MCFMCKGTDQTPEQQESKEMDGLMAVALDIHKKYAKDTDATDGVLDRSALADLIAATMMYECQPKTIARTLAVMMGRYHHLLAVFGDRYAADPQGEFIDEMPYLEWKRAATRALNILNEQDTKSTL